MPKMRKQAEAIRDGVINAKNYNFNQILTRKIIHLTHLAHWLESFNP